MRIIFLGDSITEGTTGVSYFHILKNKMIQHQLINYGKGGDTVISLYKRIQTLDLLCDKAVLWVGVNDILVKVKWYFPIIKWLQRQPCSKNIEVFEKDYRRILDLLKGQIRTIYTVPPLFIGEDEGNRWNDRLKVLSDRIQNISADYDDVIFINLRQKMLDFMIGKSLSGFWLRSAWQTIFDYFFLKKAEDVDKISQERGLHLTLDGVHLNSNGAHMAADTIYHYLEKN